ncbi:MAG: IgGFc-binding protein [Myxococcota bacterium]
MRLWIVAWVFAACADNSFKPGHEGEAESEGEETCEDGGAAGLVACEADGAFRVCRDGRWRSGVCDGGCEDGACLDNACPDGAETSCAPDGSIRSCDPGIGGWETSYCTTAETCDGDGCVLMVCLPDLRSCGTGDDANVVYECNANGSAATEVETCANGDVCGGGACISACQQAEDNYSFIGCVYYALDTDNDSGNDPLQYDVVVANPGDDPASVTLSERTGGAWSAMTTVSVAARGVAIIPTTCAGGGGFFGGCVSGNLREDRHPEDTTIARGYAFRVESDVPIIAYQFNSDDLNGSASSSGATILMPKAALDLEYYAVTLPQSGAERGWVSVVAMEDDTTVTLRASDATVAGGDVEALGPGESTDATLQDGDVLQVASAAAGDDLSGTKVLADKPVAVFAGNECGNTGGDGGGFGACDHTEEEMMPVVTWGQEFVAARVDHPDQQYSNPDDAVTWKIVASKDDTNVTFEAGPDVTGLPPGVVTLDTGSVAAFRTTGTGGNFTINATEAVQVVQFMEGEVVAIVVVPKEQYLPDYVFLAPPFFRDTLVIARQSGTTVVLDGAAPPVTWEGAGDDFEVGRLNELSDGSHTIALEGGLKGQNAGIQLVGMDSNCSYGYLGGLNALRINIPE